MSGRFKSRLSKHLGVREITQLVSLDDGSIKTVRDGKETYEFDVNIDWDDVFAMAKKAAQSKGGRSQSGPIQVVITNRTRR